MTRRVPGPGVRIRDGHPVAYVQVGDQQRYKRFAIGTPPATVRAWREETRASLRAAGLRGARGTLAADVPVYLKTLADRPALQKERTYQLQWWVDRFGHRARSSLTPQEIVTALAERRAAAEAAAAAATAAASAPAAGATPAEEQPRPPGGSASTCNHYRMALRALYTALDAGTGAPNPVASTDTFSPPTEEARGLSYDLVHVILDAMSDIGEPKHRLDGSKAKARLRVIAYTGMRHSELKRFKPEDWNREQHSLIIRTGKGGRTRTIPLVTEAEAALTDLLRIGALGSFSNSPVHRAFRLACEKVQVDGIRPYDLRHTFGTWLYAAAGDLRIVAEMMGHSRTRTTERYTLGYVPDYMRVVSQRFQALLDPSAPEADKPRLTLVKPAPARRQTA